MNTQQNESRVTVTTFLLAVTILQFVAGSVGAAPMKAGDILVADSEAAVIRVDPKTGRHAIFAAGGSLVRPFGIATDANGNIYVSDTGALAIVQIDPKSAKQTVIPWGSGHGAPYGIAVDSQGDLIVANAAVLTRVNPLTGEQNIISNSLFKAPIGVAIDANGTIFVADAGDGSVIQVDSPTSGHVVCTGLSNPCGIAVEAGGTLLVTEMDAQRITRIDVQAQTVDVQINNGTLVTPVGLAVAANGTILVGDPDVSHLPDDLAGGLFRIDPVTGDQTLLYNGSGNLVNPRGVAVMPAYR